MASEKPQKDKSQKGKDDAFEFDRADALKKALLKLQQQGKIKDLPPDMFDDFPSQADESADMTMPSRSTADVESVADSPSDMTISSRSRTQGKSPTEEKSSDAPAPDITIPSRSQAQKKQTAVTSDDVEQTQAEKTEWSGVLSGWDAPPQEDKTDDKKRETDEVEVVVDPVQDEAMAQIAVESAIETEGWGNWDSSADDASDSDKTILDDWGAPEILDEPQSEQALVIRKQIQPDAVDTREKSLVIDDTPWTLQQFFNGEIDLDLELQKRFPAVPIVSAVKFRTIGSEAQRRVATLTSTDGTASVIIDADVNSKEVQISFTFGSMLTLRYSLSDLTDTDRSRWLELMRRDKGGLAFLWGPTRWQKDYLICISRQYATKIYAFSPNHFESAVRLSQEVMDELVKWLDEIWSFQPKDDNDDAPLLTW